VEKFNILVDDWPPYSPHHNSIEHGWVEPEHRIHRKYPDIGNTNRSRHTMKAKLPEVWPMTRKEILEAYSESV